MSKDCLPVLSQVKIHSDPEWNLVVHLYTNSLFEADIRSLRQTELFIHIVFIHSSSVNSKLCAFSLFV